VADVPGSRRPDELSIVGRRTVLIGLVAVCLSACSHALPRLTHPAFSEHRWKLDDSECARNATLVRGDRSTLTRLFGRSDTENQVYYRCMVRRGYRPTIEARPRPAPRRDMPHVEETMRSGERAEPAESPAPGELPDAPQRFEAPDRADGSEPAPPTGPDGVEASTESPKAAEPADPPDSMAPTDSAQPADAAEPGDSREPTDAAEPPDAAKPREETESIEPEEATESEESTGQQVDKQIETQDPTKETDSMAIEGTGSIGESERARKGEAGEDGGSR